MLVVFLKYEMKVWIYLFFGGYELILNLVFFILYYDVKWFKKKERKKEFILIIIKSVLCLIKEFVEYMFNKSY